MKFGQVIKNGLMLAIARLPMTIGVRLATLIPTGIAFVVALLVPNGFLYAMMGLAGYYLILGNSMTRFVDASFTNAVFDKYINSRIEGVEINRADFAASYRKSVVEALVERTREAARMSLRTIIPPRSNKRRPLRAYCTRR